MAVIGGIRGENQTQQFIASTQLSPLTVYQETTDLFDGLVADIRAGTLALETLNQYPAYDISVTTQVIFPQSNSRLELQIVKDGVAVEGGLILETNGNAYFQATVLEDFRAIAVHGRNASEGTAGFGSQDTITPVFQFIKLAIAGRTF